jgi:uncharacterized protein (TIGR03437 family)
VQVSRNGRFILNSGHWYYWWDKTEFREIRDLQIGTVSTVDVWPASDRQSVTSDGRVLGWDLQFTGALWLWSSRGMQQVPTAPLAQHAIISDNGRSVVYQTESGNDNTLHSFDFESGRGFVLARADDFSFLPSISNDGRTIVFGQASTAYVVNMDGSGRRPLAAIEEGVTNAVIAGFGRYAFVITKLSRLLKVDVQTGTITELIPRTLRYALGSTALVPGSLLPIRTTALAVERQTAAPPLPLMLGGIQVLVNGQPMPIFSVSPVEVWFQVPWKLGDPGVRVDVRLNEASVFEGGPGQTVVDRRAPYFMSDDGQLVAVHSDFSSLVTRDRPARAGEILHFYGVGFGPVDPPVPTGLPAPSAPLARLRDTFECYSGPQRGSQLDVSFAGLAPGMIGIYQVDVRLPDTIPGDTFYLVCGFPEDPWDYHGGWMYAKQ